MRKRTVGWLTVLMVGLPAVVLCAGANSPGTPHFAVYRATVVDPRHGELRLGAPWVRDFLAYKGQAYFLAHSTTTGPPIITDADISEYCWDGHRIVLTQEGSQKWNAVGGWNAPLEGIPVLVVVDGEPCYAAMIWNLLSSGVTQLPMYNSASMNGIVRTRCCFCRDGESPPPDVRENETVRECLQQTGKLVEDCREQKDS